MKSVRHFAWTAGATAAILGLAWAVAWPAWDWDQARDFTGRDRAARAEAAVSLWPAGSALAARAMMEEYGPPDEIDAARLTWSGNGPWLRTVVCKTGLRPHSGENVVEQTVRYEVPRGKRRVLAGFGRGLSYDARSRELSARSSSEELNFLALNLADRIARGRMTPEAADRFYLQTTAESMAGKSSPYMKGLLFETQQKPSASDWRRQSHW
jgi:hypothetical protein